VTVHGGKLEKITRRYHCQQCLHSWDFVERTAGDVPGSCSSCGSSVFDHPNPRMEKKPRTPLASRVWEGSIIGPGRVKEWDPESLEDNPTDHQ